MSKKRKQRPGKRERKLKAVLQSPYYQDGRTAFLLGRDADENPFPKEAISTANPISKRKEWFIGYYDQWRWNKWGKNEDENITAIR